MKIFLPFHIPKLVKSLPFYIPEAWKRYPFRAEPPRIDHYREYPPGVNKTDMTLKEQAVSLLDGVGERRWHSLVSVRLQPRWPGFDSSSVPYVGWGSCCFSPWSQGFFLVFLPAQKPAFPNSISTRREDLNENYLIFIKFWCSLYFRWWASWSRRQFLCFISLEIKLPRPVAQLIYNLIWIRQVELKATAAVMQTAHKVQNTISHFSWTI